MSWILAIETGTDVCSVALSRDGQTVALRESGPGRDHARYVASFTQELLREQQLDAEEIDAVAVGRGPGSYTGLRIGASFAKGLCYGLSKPLIAIGSLDGLVQVVREEYEAGLIDHPDWAHAVLCPMLDARRMEVYMQTFDTAGSPLSPVRAEVVTASTLGNEAAAPGGVLLFGPGAAKCHDLLARDGVRMLHMTPSASGLARPAQRAFDEGRFEDAAYFEPFYLKDFVITAPRKKVR